MHGWWANSRRRPIRTGHPQGQAGCTLALGPHRNEAHTWAGPPQVQRAPTACVPCWPALLLRTWWRGCCSRVGERGGEGKGLLAREVWPLQGPAKSAVLKEGQHCSSRCVPCTRARKAPWSAPKGVGGGARQGALALCSGGKGGCAHVMCTRRSVRGAPHCWCLPVRTLARTHAPACVPCARPAHGTRGAARRGHSRLTILARAAALDGDLLMGVWPRGPSRLPPFTLARPRLLPVHLLPPPLQHALRVPQRAQPRPPPVAVAGCGRRGRRGWRTRPCRGGSPPWAPLPLA